MSCWVRSWGTRSLSCWVLIIKAVGFIGMCVNRTFIYTLESGSYTVVPAGIAVGGALSKAALST